MLIHYVVQPGFPGPAPDATFTLSRLELIAVMTGGNDITDEVKSGAIKVSGNPAKIKQLKDVMGQVRPELQHRHPVSRRSMESPISKRANAHAISD